MTTAFAVIVIGSALVGVSAFLTTAGHAWLKANALSTAAAIALGATLGSLYLSEVKNFFPCELCWFQRVAMYPLGVLLPLAALRRDRWILEYAAVLAAAGLAVSTYHVQLQWFPSQGSSCDVGAPCTQQWIDALGFMTIPQMAWLCFAGILGLGLLARDR